MYDHDIDDLTDMVIAKKRLSAKARKRAKIAAAAAVVGGAAAGLRANTKVIRTTGPNGNRHTVVEVGRTRNQFNHIVNPAISYRRERGGFSNADVLNIGHRKSDGKSRLSLASYRSKHDPSVPVVEGTITRSKTRQGIVHVGRRAMEVRNNTDRQDGKTQRYTSAWYGSPRGVKSVRRSRNAPSKGNYMYRNFDRSTGVTRGRGYNRNRSKDEGRRSSWTSGGSRNGA